MHNMPPMIPILVGEIKIAGEDKLDVGGIVFEVTVHRSAMVGIGIGIENGMVRTMVAKLTTPRFSFLRIDRENFENIKKHCANNPNGITPFEFRSNGRRTVIGRN